MHGAAPEKVDATAQPVNLKTGSLLTMRLEEDQIRRIVKFCAEECARQHSNALSVHHMFEAWLWMATTPSRVGLDTILRLGRMIEPCNNNGFRNVNVTVNGKLKKTRDFYRAIDLLCRQQEALGPIEFYREFEEIHPFIDGNGRTGAIMYNAMLGTLTAPIECPDVGNPEFWR